MARGCRNTVPLGLNSKANQSLNLRLELRSFYILEITSFRRLLDEPLTPVIFIISNVNCNYFYH